MTHQTTNGATNHFIDASKVVGAIAGTMFYVALLIVWIGNVIRTSNGFSALEGKTLVLAIAVPVAAASIATSGVLLLFYCVLRLFTWIVGKQETQSAGANES